MRLNVYTSTLWLLTMLMFGLHLTVNYWHSNGNASSCNHPTSSLCERTNRRVDNEAIGSGIVLSSGVAKQRVPTWNETGSITWLANEELMRVRVTNRKLKEEIASLKRKEKQLKILARRLAANRKGDLHYVLPRLDPNLPWVFALTPTYARFTQKADLVRLSQTLMHVVNIHWVIVEDAEYRTDLVSRLLIETGLSFTHLNLRTPTDMQRKRGETRKKHHRGIVQRNLALKWIRDNVDPAKTPGCVYFMDDDNTYHIKIFDEMRFTKHVSVWPVGLSGGARFQGPVVARGRVARFHTNWAPERTFPLDMAGFAVSLDLLVKRRPWVEFNSTVQRGFMEPSFLEQLTTVEQLEPLADNCTKVYVWHTRTEVPLASLRGERQLIRAGTPSDTNIET